MCCETLMKLGDAMFVWDGKWLDNFKDVLFDVNNEV